MANPKNPLFFKNILCILKIDQINYTQEKPYIYRDFDFDF